MRNIGVRKRDGLLGPDGMTNVPGSRRGRRLDTVREQKARDSYLEEALRRFLSAIVSLWHNSLIVSAGDSTMAGGAKGVFVVKDKERGRGWTIEGGGEACCGLKR